MKEQSNNGTEGGGLAASNRTSNPTRRSTAYGLGDGGLGLGGLGLGGFGLGGFGLGGLGLGGFGLGGFGAGGGGAATARQGKQH